MLTENSPVQLTLQFDYAEAGISDELAEKLEAHAIKQENINAALRDTAVDAVIETAHNFYTAKLEYEKEHQEDETWAKWCKGRLGCSVSTADRGVRVWKYFAKWDIEQLRLIPASRLLPITDAKLKGKPLQALKRLVKKDEYLTARQIDALLGKSDTSEKNISAAILHTEEELHDKLLKRIKAVREQAEDPIKGLVPDQLRAIADELNGKPFWTE